MKILHIITDGNIGGAGRLLCYLIAGSDRNKYEYYVLLPKGSLLKPRLEELGVSVTEIDGLNSSASLKAVKTMTKAIKKLNPDIAHTHSSLSGQLAAQKAGVRTRIMTKHCSDLPPIRFRLFLRFMARLYFSGISRCIATDDSAALAMRAIGFPKKKITVVYNGSPKLERPDDASLSALRNKLGIPEDRITVGFFGRLEPEKGPEILLQAASLCLRFTHDIHFLICGDGSEKQELENLARRWGLSDNVTFCGFVSDVAPYMSLCKIIASPSVAVETSSLSLCEALSLGLIPVVTDVGGSRALIGGCGICVPPDDPPAVYRAIMQLVRDPDLCALYSRKARARFFERCTAERMVKETCRIYDEVADTNRVC